MDAVVYPDKSVREIAKSFVCIRVDFDKNPALVNQYQVGPLTDVRLIDGEGREVGKLVGFTSAAKLASRCRGLLEGRPPEKGEGPSGRKVGVSKETVEAAEKKGVAYLRGAVKRGWPETPGLGPGEIVLFTLASCGLDESDGDFAGLAASIAKTPLVSTYSASLRALAFARVDSKRHHEALQACSRFLVGTQLENGQWTYTSAQGAAVPKLGDNSNTAYALLGLAACRKAGTDVPEAAIRRAEQWWRKSQREDGGWGYRSDRENGTYASMTENGIASLLLCGAVGDAAIDRAMKWLIGHFSVSENCLSAYQQGRLLYHLFALERVGTLLKADKIGGHDWYEEGAAWLLSSQSDGGHWDDGSETPVPNTCFALLFLSRATQFLR